MTQHPDAAMPTVAVISHVHPSISKGGAEVSAYNTFLGLRALGVPAVFIAAVPHAAREGLMLGPDEYAVFHDPDRYDHLYQLGEPAALVQLRRILKRTGARLLNFHHYLYLGANTLRDLAEDPAYRTFLTLHEFLAVCPNHGQMITRQHGTLCAGPSDAACGACFPELGWRRMNLRAAALREAFAAVEGFISPSRFLAERYIAWGVPAERMTVIENGLAHLPAVPPPARAATPGRTWVFGYFGQVTPFKGVDTLLSAAELLAAQPGVPQRVEIRIHGNIVGVPPAFEERLKALTGSLPFLRYLGPYQNSDVLELISDCDYVVMSSLWWENSPVVIQEAFAAARPVICPGIGGMAEKVRDGVSGLHFRRADAADLARVLVLAAEDKRHASLRAGLPVPFDAVEMARRYLACFAGMAEAPAPLPTPQAVAPKLAKVPRRKPQRMELTGD